MAVASQTFDPDSAAAFLSDTGPSSAASGASGTPAAVSQDQSWLRYPKLAANALVGGIVNTLGLPGAVAGLGNSALTAGANWLTGANVPAPPGFANPQQLMAGTNALGLTNRPEALPTSGAERYGTAAVEGAIPGLLGGPAGAVAGGLGGMAGEAAHQLAPDNSWLPAVAGTAVGLGAGGVNSLVQNALTGRTLAKNAEAAQQALATAQNARQLAQDAARYGPQERAAALAQHEATVTQQLGDMGHSLGSSQSLQDAGDWLQAHAKHWIDEVLPERQAAAWAPVNETIPQDAPVDLSRFRGALKQINSSAGELEPVAQALKPKLPLQLEAMLGHVERDGAAPLALDEAGNITPVAESGATQTYSWQDVQKLRSTLGDAMANPAIVKDMGAKNMNRLYATLTGDMRDAAAEHGAAELFDAANKQSTALYDLAENHIGKLLIGANGAALAPEKAAAQALSGATKGGTGLATLRAELPDAINELAAAHLQNPAAWGKLAPEAKQALLPGQQAATVDSLLDSVDTAKQALGEFKQTTGNAAYEAGNKVNTAKQAADAAAAALAAHAPQANALALHLGSRMMGAAAGSMLGHGTLANELLGGALGYVAPSIVTGIHHGLAGSVSASQLALPALAGIAGYDAGNLLSTEPKQ